MIASCGKMYCSSPVARMFVMASSHLSTSFPRKDWLTASQIYPKVSTWKYKHSLHQDVNIQSLCLITILPWNQTFIVIQIKYDRYSALEATNSSQLFIALLKSKYPKPLNAISKSRNLTHHNITKSSHHLCALEHTTPETNAPYLSDKTSDTSLMLPNPAHRTSSITSQTRTIQSREHGINRIPCCEH